MASRPQQCHLCSEVFESARSYGAHRTQGCNKRRCIEPGTAEPAPPPSELPSRRPELAVMLARWRERLLVTDGNITRIKQDFRHHHDQAVAELVERIAHKCPGCDREQVAEVVAEAASFWDGLETTSAELRATDEILRPTAPIRRRLGTRYNKVETAFGEHTTAKYDDVFDIPAERATEKLLSNPDLARSAMQEYHPDPDIIRDIRDGTIYSQNRLVRQLKGSSHRVLLYLLYGGDVELTCPIGAFRGEKKFTFFYWVLVNLDPQHRNAPQYHIQLACVCFSKTLKQYGASQVLGGDPSNPNCTSFLASIRRMRQGVTLSIEGVEQIVYGDLLLWTGDHPYAAALMRRKESVGPTTHRNCLICDCTPDTVHEIHDLCQSAGCWTMLTSRQLDQDVTLVNTSKGLAGARRCRGFWGCACGVFCGDCCCRQSALKGVGSECWRAVHRNAPWVPGGGELWVRPATR
eukprot:TRINITY_DN10234_c0_g1_i2.p1 TRINITY_DN10234_c0_g1~~TRINITY_DN10234_c0_g1_i2.p1  ORF type:complete len:463 (+),score=37.77 TRINITY_DN10234_c0_g1_i2:262-1650(+)